MSTRFQSLFPTVIGQGLLPGHAALNRELKQEIASFSGQDHMGRKWSKENYRGGYTSYASLSDMHYRSPGFARFAEALGPEVEAFARAQRWEMRGLRLEMTACWFNLMPRHTYHALHHHPHSVVSGVYYVSVPKGSVALKIEDPRIGFFMNAPLRKPGKDDIYHRISPKPGMFVLFESWVRHEVPPNQSDAPRVSISFNYSLVPNED